MRKTSQILQYILAGNKQQVTDIISAILLLCYGLFFIGCAGPLDTATRQMVESSYMGKTYLAKMYLGNRYNLEYTNNAVEGRSPTGIFIDRSLQPWYETDATFWESGTAGRGYTLDQLRVIDTDLEYDSFAQGIVAGQQVFVKKIDDRSDQVIFEIETVKRHDATKTYGVEGISRLQKRASRLHFVLGEEGMRPLDQYALDQMVNALLEPAPTFVTEEQKAEFIISQYSRATLEDLATLTGLTENDVLEIYYQHLLSQSKLASAVQKNIVKVLVRYHDRLPFETGLHIEDVRLTDSKGKIFLQIDCLLQEISDAALYHSQELRAGLVFFDSVIFLAKPLGEALASLSVEQPRLLEGVMVNVSYPYIDERGRRFPENVTYTILTKDLQQYAQTAISDQTLADRSKIVMGISPLKVNLSALNAVKNVRQIEATSWKVVEVEISDWDYGENLAEGTVKIEGEVKNIGTWIAKDVEVKAVGYNQYGTEIRSEYTTLYGLLKPGQRKSFTITIKTEDMKRFKLFVKWKAVE